jgi:ORF6N domain
VSTRVLTQAVRRNRERFPGDFLFQLVADEVTILRSQTVISSLGHGGRRYRPYAFTEQGIAMLSSVFRSRRAVRVNVEWLDGANAGSASSGPRSRPALEHQLDARGIQQHGDVLRSQTVISNDGRGKRRYLPYGRSTREEVAETFRIELRVPDETPQQTGFQRRVVRDSERLPGRVTWIGGL